MPRAGHRLAMPPAAQGAAMPPDAQGPAQAIPPTVQVPGQANPLNLNLNLHPSETQPILQPSKSQPIHQPSKMKMRNGNLSFVANCLATADTAKNGSCAFLTTDRHTRNALQCNIWHMYATTVNPMMHYDDVIMDAIASQITSLASVYSDV